MLKKGSILYSIFKNKCPRCQEGDFYKYKTTYNFNKVISIHENCPKCNFKYTIEPSFFYGAMYVNYGIAVGLSVAIFIICNVFIGMEMLPSFAAIIIVSLLLTPVSLRLSRIIYLNLFVSYNEKVNAEVNRINEIKE